MRSITYSFRALSRVICQCLCYVGWRNQGAVSIKGYRRINIAIHFIRIRRSHDRFIFKIWISVMKRRIQYSKEGRGRGSIHNVHYNIHTIFFFVDLLHYDDVIMGAIASLITSLTIVYSTIYSGTDQSKHQSSASLVFVWGIHRGPVNSPHKWPVTRKMFPFDDVIMMPCQQFLMDPSNVFIISSGTVSLELGKLHVIIICEIALRHMSRNKQ